MRVKLRVIAVTQVLTHPWKNEFTGDSCSYDTNTRYWAVDESGALWSCGDNGGGWGIEGLPPLEFDKKEDDK